MLSMEMPELLDYIEKLIFKAGLILVMLIELVKFIAAQVKSHPSKK